MQLTSCIDLASKSCWSDEQEHIELKLQLPWCEQQHLINWISTVTQKNSIIPETISNVFHIKMGFNVFLDIRNLKCMLMVFFWLANIQNNNNRLMIWDTSLRCILLPFIANVNAYFPGNIPSVRLLRYVTVSESCR